MSFNSLKKTIKYRVSYSGTKETDILLSLHMKATMMKVSDPIIFAHAVRVYFSDLIEKHVDTFNDLGVDFKNGFGDFRLDSPFFGDVF